MKRLLIIAALVFMVSPSWAAVELDADANGGVDIGKDGTNATTAGAARTNLGVGTGDNPSFNSVHASGGNMAANNAQVTKKWITGLQYTADVTSVIHGGKHFICTSTHTASAAGATGDEPGVGDTWATKWKYAGDAIHVYGDNTMYSQDSEPSTCATGDVWIDTNGTSGQRIYTCESANTWVAQAGGSGSMTWPSSAGIPNYSGSSSWSTSYTLDTDLSSTSASDDTLPSAKATKTALDAKAAGPASATDTAIVLFDGTTGKLIKGSVCTISAAGVISCTVADGSRYATLPNNTTGNMPASATVVNGFFSYINELYGVENSGTASKVVLSNDVDDTPANGATADPVSSNWAYGHEADTSTHGTTGAIVGISDTQTLTGKTIDVEGTGNAITIVDKVWFAAAGCNNTTATSFYDLPTSNPAAAACITGTNTQKGVLDFDAATDESGQVSLALPSDWSGNIDLRYKWSAAATSGSVVWGVQTSCVADAETDDPSWNTASTATDAAKGTTLQTNDASMTSITVTGCAAGELMHLRFFRDADNGSDDMTGDARLIGVELTLRRAQ